MIQRKNETEDLLLSITINCETLIEQTHRKTEETLEFKMIKPRETFRFNPRIQMKKDRVIGSISLRNYNSIFNITEENKNFELYTDTLWQIFFTQLNDEIEEIPNNSDITLYHLQNEVIGHRFSQIYWKFRSKKSITDRYVFLLIGYARSLFQDSVLELLLVWMKMIFSYFWNKIMKNLSLMEYHLVFTQ